MKTITRKLLPPGLLLLVVVPVLAASATPRYAPAEGRQASVSNTQGAARTIALKAEVMAVAFSPDGQRVASGSYDHDAYVTVWNAATGELVWKGKGHDRPVLAVACSSDGKTLATGGVERRSCSGTPRPASRAPP